MASLNKQRNNIMILLTIYNFVDEFLKTALSMVKFSIIPAQITNKRPPRKKRYLSLSEIVTLGIFRFYTGHKNWKDFYWHIKTYHKIDFPNLPCYSKFVDSMNMASPLALVLCLAFAKLFRQTNRKLPNFTDSSRLRVCEIKREFSHKVCKGLAQKSKSTMGWFYGFKLHIVSNQLMQILAVTITPGNTDDRKGLAQIWQHIFGLIVADAGYVGKEFSKKAARLKKIMITGVRANMKKLMSSYQHQLLKLRQSVETIFSVLKLRFHIENTLPRSPLGYFGHYCWCLAAYQLKQFFKLPYLPKPLVA